MDVSDCVYAHVAGSGCLAQCLHLSVSEFGHLGPFPLPDLISPRERVCVAMDLIACDLISAHRGVHSFACVRYLHGASGSCQAVEDASSIGGMR